MPPNYRQGEPLTRRDRKGALAVGTAVVALGAGLGIWGLAGGGGGGGGAGRCVSLVIASSTGGGTVRHCGKEARTWCVAEDRLTGALASQARAACRRAGL